MKKISERIKEGLALREMKQADLVNLSGISKGACFISLKAKPSLILSDI